MDDVYASRVNDRILNGNFPHCQLKQDIDKDVNIFDLRNKLNRGQAIIQSISKPFSVLLQAYAYQVDELEEQFQEEGLAHKFNFFINTLINPDTINMRSDLAQKVTCLFPVVTRLDRALWGAILEADMLSQMYNDDSFDDLYYAWTRLLLAVQRKEYKYKKTINLTAINEADPILSVLCKSWDNTDEPYFIGLTDQEIHAFEALHYGQNELKSEVLQAIDEAKTVAAQTARDWEQFICILNDLQARESQVVAKICASVSRSEKLIAINEYNSVLNQLHRGTYILQNESIALEPLFSAVEKRMNCAPAQCFVIDCDNNSFRLCPEVLELVKTARTFNYLFISYHHFRMDPSEDNALHFSKLSLACLQNNLCIAPYEAKSVESIAKTFYSIVRKFYDKNQKGISQLLFNKIQLDSIIVSGPSEDTLIENRIREHFLSTAQATLSSLNPELLAYKDMEEVKGFVEQFNVQLYKRLGVQRNNLDPVVEDFVDKDFARLLVVSLNIIYLFCDALKIMIDNNQDNRYFKSTDSVNKYRLALRKISTRVGSDVYTDDVDLEEDREYRKLNSVSISRQEEKEEELRNSTFTNICVSYITELSKRISTLDIEGLISVNKAFKEEILNCPTSRLKEAHIEELDAVSQQLCANLISACQIVSSESFSNEKASILSKLGSNASLLPASTVNSLTTAELLYHQFASDNYALKGFDYSCISALYYQAFEEAYNKLIWSGYANLINNETIGDRSLCSILFEFRDEKITIEEAKGYLSQNIKTRGYYLDYADKESATATVKPYCMYKNFALLLYQIKKGSSLSKLCDYFATLTGFSGREKMFEDSSFMDAVRTFAKDIDDSARYRNNASHGGALITIEQCQKDKHTVLSELSELNSIRQNSIGLIQKLLQIMSKNAMSPTNK